MPVLIRTPSSARSSPPPHLTCMCSFVPLTCAYLYPPAVPTHTPHACPRSFILPSLYPPCLYSSCSYPSPPPMGVCPLGSFIHPAGCTCIHPHLHLRALMCARPHMGWARAWSHSFMCPVLVRLAQGVWWWWWWWWCVVEGGAKHDCGCVVN